MTPEQIAAPESMESLCFHLRDIANTMSDQIDVDRVSGAAATLEAQAAEIARLRAALRAARPRIIDMAGAMDKMTPEFMETIAPLFATPIVAVMEKELAGMHERAEKAEVENVRLRDALKETAQSLKWQIYEDCSGFSENLFTPSAALSLARTALGEAQ